MSNMISSMNCINCGAEIDKYINGEQYCKDCYQKSQEALLHNFKRHDSPFKTKISNFEKIRSFNSNEMSIFLDNISIDDNPWIDWFDKKYCDNCDSVPSQFVNPYTDKYDECSYCEINNKCIFFQDLNTIPSNKDLISIWLGNEYDGWYDKMKENVDEK